MEEHRENTDLIDVSDVAEHFEAETPEEESKSISNISEPPNEQKGGFMLASLKDRLAAAIIDGIILYGIYWFLMIAYRAIVFGQAEGPIPASGWHGLVFHGLFCLIAFLYFFIFESVFFASIGKLICRMGVRDASGEQASLGGIFLRNLVRPIDILLFPLAIGFVLIEKTGWHQRFGDLIGKTVVIRKLGTAHRQYALSLDVIASASGRLGAFIIDSVFFVILFLGYALLLNPDEPLISMILVVAAPVAFFLFYFLPEATTQTSIGKWAAGYVICQEDGTSLDASGAVIRTSARIFDMNIFGFLCTLLSIRRQRPGDLAAGTVVCSVQRQLKGFIGALVMAVVVIAIFFAGFNNRNNFLSGSFKINFLPGIDLKMAGLQGLETRPIQNLIVQQFSFAAGSPDQKRKPSIFQPGETVYIVFNVDGFQIADGKAWIQEDLMVRYPDESIGLKLENVIDFHETVIKEGPVEFSNNIALPQNALPGRYTVTLTLRDKNSDRQLKEQRFFYVTPSGGVQKPAEEPAQPPTPPPAAVPETPPVGPRTIIPQPSAYSPPPL